MSLPHADRCVIDRVKLVGYLLNLAHPEGQAKARFFLSRGFEAESWDDFAAALKRHALDNAVAQTTVSPHGTKYLVVCRIATPDGRNPCIHTVWIDEGDHRPRLVTAHPR